MFDFFMSLFFGCFLIMNWLRILILYVIIVCWIWIIVGFNLNSIVFWRMVSLIFWGIIIFIFDLNVLCIVFWSNGDLENLFIRKRNFRLVIFFWLMRFLICLIILCNMGLKSFFMVLGVIFNIFCEDYFMFGFLNFLIVELMFEFLCFLK